MPRRAPDGLPTWAAGANEGVSVGRTVGVGRLLVLRMSASAG